MSDSVAAIQKEILSFIDQHQVMDGHHESDEDFNQLALDLFQYQFDHNLPYKKYAQQQRKSPLMVHRWQEVPLMPIQGYKQLTLSTTPITAGEAVFMSSGTTDKTHRSHSYHPTFAVWNESMKVSFKQYVLPDVDQITIIGLFPDEKHLDNSSLAHYVSRAITEFGDQHSRSYVDADGIDYQGVVAALTAAEIDHRPVMLLGASFSYVHFLDYLQKHQLVFHLAEKSRIFDTGGFKGQSRQVSEDQLLADLEAAFGIGRDYYLNMYGMTEISSQCYDQKLWRLNQGLDLIYSKQTPAWVRVRILDTDTLAPVAPGQKGVLAYYDLSNWNSCLGILTEDLAVQDDVGFTLLGRIAGAESKGCSISVDQLLQANQA
ncbi:acyl-CoA synthetase [Fructobacillus americanaquae]|uniref:Acyl-CoA synthetase n=1 Tax=Fructobacillus americanaquae TaxID=2940302 RepID=A0ABY5BZ21_9LACO|nr:acyl-CoA synthetase [Fructobacillus americanaquae]USS91760.1 acyl-CoA synthetase [Fructobacillus americanaquae]